MARPVSYAVNLLNNVIDVDDVEASRNRVNDQIATSRYLPQFSLRENYLNRSGIDVFYNDQLIQMLQGRVINPSSDWILTREFYQGVLGVANNLTSHDRSLRAEFIPEIAVGNFAPAVAEYMQFFEVIMHRFLAESSRSLSAAGEIDINSFRYCQQLLCLPKDRVNQTIRQLFYHFYNGSQLREFNGIRWNGDFKKIIEMTIQLLKRSFVGTESQSDFLEMIPSLRDAAVMRDRVHRWTWELRNRPSYLTLLFTITMLRFPTINVSQPNVLHQGSLQFAFQSLRDEDVLFQVLNFRITNANLQSVFYFIPEMNRVFGIYPKNVLVRNSTDDVFRHMQINYKMNLIRNIVAIIDIPQRFLRNQYQLSFEQLFMDRASNLYRTVRMSNPFNLPVTEDPRRRLYISLTIYADQDSPVLHIPFILEGDILNSTAYLVDNFCEEWERVLFGTNSGDGLLDRISGISQFCFYFCFILDPTLPLASSSSQDTEEQRSQRQRVSNASSTVRNTRSRTAAGMSVGAPYAGTKKEKHFLDVSLINRFSNSAALFKTPKKRMYSCYMMSLIKCQLYCYEFDAQNKCTNLKITGTRHKASRCDNMYVETISNFDFIESTGNQYPFLVKRENKWYVQLFEPNKLKGSVKFIPGATSLQEEELWEMAAEEIWFAMEVHFQKSIDYTSLSDYGQCFADFFNVCIAVYDVEVRSQRVHVITPQKKSAKEIVQNQHELLMIHVVFDQGHMHAISSFSSFIKSDDRKDELRLYNYCPICEEKQCQSLRQNKNSALQHITDCVKTKEFVNHYDTMMEKMLQPNLQKVQKAFRKNRITQKPESFIQCKQCYEEVHQHSWMQHVCYIRKKKIVTIPESTIYVYDLEAAQIIDEMGLLKHECNCLYIRKVYCATEEEKQGRYFANEIDFMEALLTENCFINALFIAHNGGSYDIHFLLRILERQEIGHEYVPSPTSKHKFIQILITHQNLNIRFIDFMRFIPGSLKNIAEAFEIEVSKGDFPHRFNNGSNDLYQGCIPPMNTVEDYWGLSSARTEKQMNQFHHWFQEQTELYCTCVIPCHGQCGKQLWNFQNEIRKYCLLDVVVLAEIVKAYRGACMNFDADGEEPRMNWIVPKLDPLQFMTLPQITINTLIHGFKSMEHEAYDFRGIVTMGKSNRGGLNWEAILWLYELNLQQPEDPILYLGNSLKEYYNFELQLHIDGFCPKSGQIYLYLDCDYWGCPLCFQEHHEYNLQIPSRNLYASDIKKMLNENLSVLSRAYSKVITKWSHETNYAFKHPDLLEMSHLMSPSDCFYGGRTEVFQLYCNAEKMGKEIHYYDVTSLYPSVYAHHPLPLGIPVHLIGSAIDRSRFAPNAANPYFGFAKIKITPIKSDLIGLLPKRDLKSGRLFFPVEPMIGCWFTSEIYLAMLNGYEVDTIYEIYHWDERNRSDCHLGAYVNYFFQMKQEAEGWKKLGASSEEPSESEKQEIIEKLYVQNGYLGRIRSDKVKKNAVLRSLAKLYLNSLWGKLAQKPSKNDHMTLYGTQQILDLIHNPHVQLSSCAFREISPGVYKTNFKLKDEFIAAVKHGNLFIGAAVTATARCVLHQKMLQVGVRNMIYCDTDSIIFLYDPELGKLTDVGLGKWTNEYPHSVIEHVYALAPKLYSLKLRPIGKEFSYESFRAKGVQLTLQNQEKIKFNHVKVLIENLIKGEKCDFAIEVDNMNIFTNSTNNQLPYGQLYTRYNKKKVRAIITKRVVGKITELNWEEITSIPTFPYGYENI
jgi:hypothetical protein